MAELHRESSPGRELEGARAQPVLPGIGVVRGVAAGVAEVDTRVYTLDDVGTCEALQEWWQPGGTTAEGLPISG